MKYLIFVSLLVYYILFPDDVQAAYTKQVCVDCCMSLPQHKRNCEFGCVQKFAVSQNYNSRNDCSRSCLVSLGPCRVACLQDCIDRYPETPPGVRAPTRREKERRDAREAREAAGYYGYKPRTTKDPGGPSKKSKIKIRYENSSDEGSSNVG